jgi:hypothetical protein
MEREVMGAAALVDADRNGRAVGVKASLSASRLFVGTGKSANTVPFSSTMRVRSSDLYARRRPSGLKASANPGAYVPLGRRRRR